jgi:hypothetical protein
VQVLLSTIITHRTQQLAAPLARVQAALQDDVWGVPFGVEREADCTGKK